MKKLFVALLALTLTGCASIPSGHVAVEVPLYGDNKGEIQVRPPGRYWDTPGIEYHAFPTFMQNITWEEVSFQTKEGLAVTANIGLSYSIQESSVKDIFVKHRKGIDEITNSYVRNIVRDAFNSTASQYTVEGVYGSKKTVFLNQVTEAVKKRLQPEGFNISQLSIVGTLNLPKVVVDALGNKIAATQRAEQRENELREAEAEAAKSRVKAQAEAEANRLKGQKLTKELLEYERLQIQRVMAEKWNGALPQIQAGNSSMLFDVSKLSK